MKEWFFKFFKTDPAERPTFAEIGDAWDEIETFFVAK